MNTYSSESIQRMLLVGKVFWCVLYNVVCHTCLELATTTTLEGLVLLGISPAFNNQKYYNTFINTVPVISISISIPIPQNLKRDTNIDINTSEV